jgi:hypothetical protein
MGRPASVKIGTTFRYTHADSNPLWKVVASKGRGCWVAEIVNEPVEIDGKLIDSDWVGHTKVFGNEEIASAVKSDNFWKQSRDSHAGFYASLKVGQIVHYCNGFEDYVRCEVVNVDGKNLLKPIGLVGKWGTHNLPSRNPDGSIYYSYHAGMIVKGSTFEPNYSNIVESPSHRARPGYSASEVVVLPVIDISVPEMTPGKKKVADALALRSKIQTVLDTVNDPKSLKEFFQFVVGESVKLPLDY